MTGDDVVLAFITPPRNSFHDSSPPINKLFGFKRVQLNVNQITQLFFPLNIDSLLTVVHDGSKWLYKILIGKQDFISKDEQPDGLRLHLFMLIRH